MDPVISLRRIVTLPPFSSAVGQVARMFSEGGYTVTTEVCTYFYANKKTYPPELEAQVKMRSWLVW